MKKTAVVLVLLLLLSLCTGCGVERATVDISDGGDLSSAVSDGAEAEVPEDTEEAAPPEPEYVTLSYEGNTASITVGSVFMEEGQLAVTLKGTGYAFDGVLPLRNGRIVVPFSADVRIGGATYSWDTARFNGGEITFLYDRAEWPDQIIVYSDDNEEVTYSIDAAPFITDAPPAAEETAVPEDSGDPEDVEAIEDTEEADSILTELAGRWEGRGQPEGGGEAIFLRIQLLEDGTGTYRFRQGDYTEKYPFFINEESGSFSAEIPADNALGITGCGGTYEYDNAVLSLHIVTEFASGRSFTYSAVCERVPPAEMVTDEPYTMVTSKFSVDGLYTGEWRNGMPNGAGTLTIQETNDRWDTGDTLWSEDWVNGLIEGYGEWRSAVDGAYDGNFSAGLKEGYGRMWFGDGKVYDGQWSAGAFKG